MREVMWVRYQFHNYIHAGYKLALEIFEGWTFNVVNSSSNAGNLVTQQRS